MELTRRHFRLQSVRRPRRSNTLRESDAHLWSRRKGDNISNRQLFRQSRGNATSGKCFFSFRVILRCLKACKCSGGQMTDAFRIRQLKESEIHIPLELAMEEGWNPGIEDGPAFFTADPNGYFAGEIRRKIDQRYFGSPLRRYIRLHRALYLQARIPDHGIRPPDLGPCNGISGVSGRRSGCGK